MIYFLWVYCVIGFINLVLCIVEARRAESLKLGELFLIISAIVVPIWDIICMIFIIKEVLNMDAVIWRKKHR